MNDTTFKTDFYGVRRVFADHTSHGIAHGKKDVENLLIACQQWLAEEAEREQAKLNAEKEQRRKQWEELNKEFAGESAYRVFKRHGDGCWVHESSGDCIAKMTSDGFLGSTYFEKGDWLYIDGQKDCCVIDEAEHLEDLLEEYGIVLAR